MKADDYHLSMRPLEEACRLARSGWVCLPNPLVGWGREGSNGWKLRILLRHIALVFRCWANASHAHIVIREFSTIPLLLIFPLLWPLQKKIWFVVHHNLQWAARSPVENAALSLLAKLGAQWALFETQDFPPETKLREAGAQRPATERSEEANLGKFSIPSDKNLILPHPVPDVGQTFLSARSSSGAPVIGVAGTYRPEKGMDELIRQLQKNFPTLGILLGVSNPEAVAHLDVEVMDTSTDEAYRKMIARCDVLVQNGAQESYFYRASGPIADAAACGTAVVAPDFPIIGKQVAGIGEVFHPSEAREAGLTEVGRQRPEGERQPLELLPEAVRSAIEKARSGGYDFASYCAARSAQALANQLDAFSDGTS